MPWTSRIAATAPKVTSPSSAPGTSSDVVEVLREAQARGIPVVPQGRSERSSRWRGGSRGRHRPQRHGAGRGQRDRRGRGHSPSAGPGTVTADLKAAAAEHGLFYPPDPASSVASAHRRQRRDQRRRPVLRQVRRHRRLRPGAAGRAGRRRGDPDRPPHGQGRRRARPHRALRRVRGHPRGRHRGDRCGSCRRRTPRSPRWRPSTPSTPASRGIVALRLERHRPSMLEFLDGFSIAAVQAIADFGFPDGLRGGPDRPVRPAGPHRRRTSSGMPRCSPRPVRPTSPSPTTPGEPRRCWPGAGCCSTRSMATGPHLIEDVCVPVARLTALIAAGGDISAPDRRGDHHVGPWGRRQPAPVAVLRRRANPAAASAPRRRSPRSSTWLSRWAARSPVSTASASLKSPLAARRGGCGIHRPAARDQGGLRPAGHPQPRAGLL